MFSIMLFGRLKSIVLLCAAIMATPFAIAFCTAMYVVSKLFYVRRQKPSGLAILLTGGSSTQALVLARQLGRAGHRIILVDELLLCGARLSNCIDKFYRYGSALSTGLTYSQFLAKIVLKEHIDICIPCVPKAGAHLFSMENAHLSKWCHVMQIAEASCMRMTRNDLFVSSVAQIGLDVPLTFLVSSAHEVDTYLRRYRDRKFILKSLVDSGLHDTQKAEQLLITSENPCVMQEYLLGTTYSCQAFVWQGTVRLFSCHEGSSHAVLHTPLHPLDYEMGKASFLNTSVDLSAINRARTVQKLRDIVIRYAAAHNLTGGFTIEFIASNDRARAHEMSVLPVNASPCISSALSCFAGTLGFEMAFTRLAHNSNDAYNWPIYPTKAGKSIYSFYHEAYSSLLRHKWFTNQPRSFAQLASTIWSGQEVIWDLHDPLPFLGYYHMQWPYTLWRSIVIGKSWSSINVASGQLNSR